MHLITNRYITFAQAHDGLVSPALLDSLDILTPENIDALLVVVDDISTMQWHVAEGLLCSAATENGLTQDEVDILIDSLCSQYDLRILEDAAEDMTAYTQSEFPHQTKAAYRLPVNKRASHELRGISSALASGDLAAMETQCKVFPSLAVAACASWDGLDLEDMARRMEIHMTSDVTAEKETLEYTLNEIVRLVGMRKAVSAHNVALGMTDWKVPYLKAVEAAKAKAEDIRGRVAGATALSSPDGGGMATIDALIERACELLGEDVASSPVADATQAAEAVGNADDQGASDTGTPADDGAEVITGIDVHRDGHGVRLDVSTAPKVDAGVPDERLARALADLYELVMLWGTEWNASHPVGGSLPLVSETADLGMAFRTVRRTLDHAILDAAGRLTGADRDDAISAYEDAVRTIKQVATMMPRNSSQGNAQRGRRMSSTRRRMTMRRWDEDASAVLSALGQS